MLDFETVALLLKGWQEDSRLLRVELAAADLRIVATCTIYKIDKKKIAFHIGGVDYFETSLDGFAFDFGDADESGKHMPIGKIAESAIVGILREQELFIVLLEE